MTYQILIIEDEDIARKNLKHILKKEGYRVTDVDSGTKGLTMIKSRQFDLILTDYKMKQVDGMHVLEQARQLQPFTEVIMITGYATVDNAVRAMKEGAYHYIAKPYKIDEVRKIVREALFKRSLQLENRALKNAMKRDDRLPQIIGSSTEMEAVKKSIRQVARTDTSVLILGESGTGKELVAKAIHNLSQRHAGELVA
ncbi:MAG TPA: Fis family transcriptional regulator, partial [Desulfobacteraceae bacterium]|nr:Fis family transcriptional regulator [Desulfobacteraceae bacterium]